MSLYIAFVVLASAPLLTFLTDCFLLFEAVRLGISHSGHFAVFTCPLEMEVCTYMSRWISHQSGFTVSLTPGTHPPVRCDVSASRFSCLIKRHLSPCIVSFMAFRAQSWLRGDPVRDRISTAEELSQTSGIITRLDHRLWHQRRAIQ